MIRKDQKMIAAGGRSSRRHCFSRLIPRSTQLRCLYCAALKYGGRPPRCPLRCRASR